MGVLTFAVAEMKGGEENQAPGKPRARALTKSVTRPELAAAGGFDWRHACARRTVFTVDYWPGVPALTKEGRKDMYSDLEHFKAYADPITVRTLAFAFRQAPPAGKEERRGWFAMPDLLHLNAASYKIWAEAIEPIVAKEVGPK